MKALHLAIIAVCFAAGLGIGKLSSPSPPVVPELEPPAAQPISALTATKEPPRPPTFEALIAHFARRDVVFDGSDYASFLARPGVVKSEVLRRWAEDDPAALWKWLQENSNPKRSPGSYASAYGLISHLLRSDPAAVAAMVAESADTSLWAGVQREIIKVLSGDDPQLIARLVEHLDELLPGAVWTRRERSGDTVDGALLETVQAFPESGAKSRLRHQLTKDWFESDWSAAADWVASLPAGDREVAGRAILSAGLPRSKDTSSAQVAQWLASDSAPAGMLSVHSRRVVKDWAKSDPEAASKWITEHHTGATRLLLEADVRAARGE